MIGKIDKISEVCLMIVDAKLEPTVSSSIDVQLRCINKKIFKKAAWELTQILGSYTGVKAIDNGVSDGKE